MLKPFCLLHPFPAHLWHKQWITVLRWALVVLCHPQSLCSSPVQCKLSQLVPYHPQSSSLSPVQCKSSQLVTYHPQSSSMSPVQCKHSQLAKYRLQSLCNSPVQYNNRVQCKARLVQCHPQRLSSSPVQRKSHQQWFLLVQQTQRLRWYHRPLFSVKVRILNNNWELIQRQFRWSKYSSPMIGSD